MSEIKNEVIPTINIVKEFWNERPCNIKHSKLQVGTKEFFDEVEARRYFVEPHIPQFCQFEKWGNKSVLEIGCGIGTDGINFARSGANYTGLELSDLSLRIAQERFEIFKQNGNFLLGDAESADEKFDGKTFDLIYSFGVIHHTPNIMNALRSIKRLCHGGSTVLIMIYAKDSYKQAMIDIGLDQPEAQYGCPIANSYTTQEAVEMFEEVGFRDIKVTQDHIFPYKIDEYKNFEYVKQPWFDVMPDQVFNALKKKFGWHLLIEANA